MRVTWVRQSVRGVQWLGQPSSGRVGLTDAERFNEARSYFPSCYSKPFDDCIDQAVLTAYPNCQRLLELWGTDKTDAVSMQLDAEIQKMPYCSPPATSSGDNSTALLVGVGLAALALGFVAAGGLR